MTNTNCTKFPDQAVKFFNTVEISQTTVFLRCIRSTGCIEWLLPQWLLPQVSTKNRYEYIYRAMSYVLCWIRCYVVAYGDITPHSYAPSLHLELIFLVGFISVG